MRRPRIDLNFILPAAILLAVLAIYLYIKLS